MQKIMKSVTRWMEIRGIKMRKPIPMIRISHPLPHLFGEKTRSGLGSAICLLVSSKIYSS